MTKHTILVLAVLSGCGVGFEPVDDDAGVHVDAGTVDGGAADAGMKRSFQCWFAAECSGITTQSKGITSACALDEDSAAALAKPAECEQLRQDDLSCTGCTLVKCVDRGECE